MLHALNVLLLFGALRSLTGATWPSALAAALFAVHPLNVETVAHVSQRKGVLALTFGSMTFWAYAVWVRRRGVARYLLLVCLLCLGLMAKPTLVPVPLLLLLLDYWPLGRLRLGRGTPLGVSLGRRLLEKAPLFALAAASSLATLVVQRPALEAAQAVPLQLRLANAAVASVDYVGKAVWPRDFSFLYPHPYMSGGTPYAAWQVAGAVFTLVSVSILTLRLARSRPYALVGWLWFLGALLPTLGLVQVGGQAMADRYTYLPAIGLFVGVAFCVADLAGGLRPRQAWISPVAAGAILALLAWVAWGEARHWKNSTALFEHALVLNPGNAVAHYNLAAVCVEDGRFDEAEAHYREVLSIRPDYRGAHYGLGTTLRRRGKFEEAIVEFRRALAIAPDDSKTHNNLANALREGGDLEGAIAHYRRAVALRPTNMAAALNLAEALYTDREFDEAIREYRRTLALVPDLARAHHGLARAHEARGERVLAIQHYREAVRVEPRHAPAHNNLGNALQAEGALEEAVVHYRLALAVRPDHAKAHYNLGNTYYHLGQLEEAVAAYRGAINLTLGTERTRAWYINIGRQYFAAGFVEAVDALLEGHPPNNNLHQQLLAWK